MNHPPDLTPSQWEAVNHTDGALLVLAGPGSGKTKTLISKISYILENNLVNDFEKILCLTFTNNAANEIKNRTLSSLKKNISFNNNKNFGTYH